MPTHHCSLSGLQADSEKSGGLAPLLPLTPPRKEVIHLLDTVKGANRILQGGLHQKRIPLGRALPQGLPDHADSQLIRSVLGYMRADPASASSLVLESSSCLPSEARLAFLTEREEDEATESRKSPLPKASVICHKERMKLHQSSC